MSVFDKWNDKKSKSDDEEDREPEESEPVEDTKDETTEDEDDVEPIIEKKVKDHVGETKDESESKDEEESKPEPKKKAGTKDKPKITISTSASDKKNEHGIRADPDYGDIDSVPEEQYNVKHVFTVYGEKGEGKTTFGFNFPGDILCLSFDRKSMKIKPMVDDPDRIHVYDVMKHATFRDSDRYGRSMKTVFDVTMKILSQHPKVDWVMIDGSDMLARVAEWVMRWKYDLGLGEGIPNLNVWKYRRFVLKQVHNQSLNLARRGIIYTMYVDYDETIRSGQLVNKTKIPKWIDIIKYETDHVFHVYRDADQFKATLESAKGYQSQKKFDITGDKCKQVVKEFVEQLPSL